ncbi:MAG: GTPase, partial [candidate division Zixibacteria bacterium]|nr:GTPase [candidate division Zixibacteria bacterium]
LKRAEKEADVIVWDGGNNDLPFYQPDLHITVADPLRPGHELTYFPGEVNLRAADVVVINKVDSAKKSAVKQVVENIKFANPRAVIIKAASPITVSNPDLIRGKRVLVIEDGPTLTHGDMSYGAGVVAARKYKATLVDPRPKAVGSIKKTFEKYKQTGKLIPAMGYGEKQIKELEKTINGVICDCVVIATPIDLGKILKINKPWVRVRYELAEKSKPDLRQLIARTLK